jgi:hypothetical protein
MEAGPLKLGRPVGPLRLSQDNRLAAIVEKRRLPVVYISAALSKLLKLRRKPWPLCSALRRWPVLQWLGRRPPTEGRVEGKGYVSRSSIAASEGLLSIVPPCFILCGGFPRLLLTPNAILASSMAFSGLDAPRGVRSDHSNGVGTLLYSGMDPSEVHSSGEDALMLLSPCSLLPVSHKHPSEPRQHCKTVKHGTLGT